MATRASPVTADRMGRLASPVTAGNRVIPGLTELTGWMGWTGLPVTVVILAPV